MIDKLQKWRREPLQETWMSVSASDLLKRFLLAKISDYF
jgi:hypothetical protein